MEDSQLLGFRRPNGRVGVRNHVVVIPVDDISNAVAENVAKVVPGVIALPHPYGRLQFGDDLELTFHTLIGTGTNPNVAAAIVIGIEPAWTSRIVDGIAGSGKPVEGFSIEAVGDLRTLARAAEATASLLQDASELMRVPIARDELIISIKCGESDTTNGLGSCPAVGRVVDWYLEADATVLFGETTELTGAEHLIAERCVDARVRARFEKMHADYLEMIAASGTDLFGSQPSQGNIAGGLTTIEEKAMGNVAKTGTHKVVEAIDVGAVPSKRGLVFANTSSAGAEFITLMAAAGSVLHLFPTGQGNIVGHPILPVLKVTANARTASNMSEHIDLDVSDVLARKCSLEDAGRRLVQLTERTINGRITAAESLGHREFVLTRLYQSA